MLNSSITVGACSFATEHKKWLIVNIQTPTEFDCQRLNRDTWSDEQLASFIESQFVFWQMEDQVRVCGILRALQILICSGKVEEGQKFCQFYKVSKLPFVCIIDPRTGECVRQWEGFVEPQALLEALGNHISSCSLDSFSLPSTISECNIRHRKRKRHVVDMTEEEQLRAAISASLAEASEGEPPQSQVGREGNDLVEATNEAFGTVTF